MVEQYQIKKLSYESLVEMLKYGGYLAEDIDMVCKHIIARPKYEKTLFDSLMKQRRMLNIDDHDLCFCADKIVFRLIQAMDKKYKIKSLI